MEKHPRILYLESHIQNLKTQLSEKSERLSETSLRLSRSTAQINNLRNSAIEKDFRISQLIQEIKRLTRSNNLLAKSLKTSRASQQNRYTSVKDTPARRKLFALVEEFMSDQDTPPGQPTPAPRLYRAFLNDYKTALTEIPSDTIFIKQLLELGYTKRRMRDPDSPPTYEHPNNYCWGIYPPIIIEQEEDDENE